MWGGFCFFFLNPILNCTSIDFLESVNVILVDCD